MITVITPVYNEESNIEELFSRIDKAFLNTNFEGGRHIKRVKKI